MLRCIWKLSWVPLRVRDVSRLGTHNGHGSAVRTDHGQNDSPPLGSIRGSTGRTAADYVDPRVVTIQETLRKAGSPPPSGRSGRTVCDAEIALDKLGYQTPIIDCIWGQQLGTVVTRYQREHNLRPTGELDSETKTTLNIR